MVHGCMVYTESAKKAAVSRGTSHVNAVTPPLWWIFKKTALWKASSSYRITCDRNESAWEQRIALHKSISTTSAVILKHDLVFNFVLFSVPELGRDWIYMKRQIENTIETNPHWHIYRKKIFGLHHFCLSPISDPLVFSETASPRAGFGRSVGISTSP